MHKNLIISLRCQYGFFIHTCVSKMWLCLKIWFCTSFNITWHTKITICTKNLLSSHSTVCYFYWITHGRRQSKIDKVWHMWMRCTAWKVSKYGVFSGPYFPVFRQFSRSAGSYKKKECITNSRNKIYHKQFTRQIGGILLHSFPYHHQSPKWSFTQNIFLFQTSKFCFFIQW